jgi:Fe-S cluster biogenesis protein NfuA
MQMFCIFITVYKNRLNMETSTLLTIYAESTPNPLTMKFVVNKMLLPEGLSLDFPEVSGTTDAPLAAGLFQFSGVTGVFMAANFITVSKAAAIEWSDLIPILKTYIKGFIESGEPLVILQQKNTAHTGSEIDEKIKELLEEYIRPAVEEDGGAISFKSFDKGVVTVTLQGSCSGCPSSTLTLKAGIENLLKRMLPEVTEVVSEAL